MSIWTVLSLALIALFILCAAAVSVLALSEAREEKKRETPGERRLAALSLREKLRLLNALEEDGVRRRKRLPSFVSFTWNGRRAVLKYKYQA